MRDVIEVMLEVLMMESKASEVIKIQVTHQSVVIKYILFTMTLIKTINCNLIKDIR